MAEAKLYHGVALVGYVDGVPVDANGNKVEGAPKLPAPTDPSKQPHGMAALNAEERSAAILANALAEALGKTAPAERGSTTEDDGDLPTVAELDDHLAGITSIDEVKALKRTDHRATAKPKYDARIAELKASSAE